MDFLFSLTGKNSVSVFKHSQKIGHRFSCKWQLSLNFYQLCDVQELVNPDLNKNSDKCFFSNLENRAEVRLHTANFNGFSMFSWLFHHLENSRDSRLAFCNS